jgi:hypothetical protein
MISLVVLGCRFLKRKKRTIDQMVQAARSGKQNILEGSRASGTSKETELKLTAIAHWSYWSHWSNPAHLPPPARQISPSCPIRSTPLY